MGADTPTGPHRHQSPMCVLYVIARAQEVRLKYYTIYEILIPSRTVVWLRAAAELAADVTSQSAGKLKSGLGRSSSPRKVNEMMCERSHA